MTDLPLTDDRAASGPDGWPRQLLLPGQACVADGPYDQTGMYVMHHALRRDLDRFVTAVRGTPVHDAATWRALFTRWQRVCGVLHDHHTIEDDHLWPVLHHHADTEGREVLHAMAAEHDTIDPALDACRTGFEAMIEHPCADHRNALDVHLTATRESLCRHLDHEETDALPLLQRLLTRSENAEVEKHAKTGHPARTIPFLVPWILDQLPAEAAQRLFDEAGPVYVLLHRLLRRGYDRRGRAAFRYA